MSLLSIRKFSVLLLLLTACQQSGLQGGSQQLATTDAQTKADPKTYVDMLYQAILWRDPDYPGSNGYYDTIKRHGLSGLVVSAMLIANSPEYWQRIHTTHSADQILDRLYVVILGRNQLNHQTQRPVDLSGINSYTHLIQSGKTYLVVNALLRSVEFSQRLMGATSTSASATPTPSGACRLPPMPECGNTPVGPGFWGCCREGGQRTFADVIERAIDQIKAQQPQLFSGERVLNELAYMQGVVNILNSYGYCATHGGPGDEVGIKNTNGSSEQYDILLSSGYIRRNGFTVTCTPARF